MFHFQNLRHNTETQKTDLLYSPHHIGQYSSVKLHEARPLVLLYPTRGNTGREQQETRDLVKLQQTPNLWWIVHGGLQYATAIVTSPKQAAHRVEQTRAKKELVRNCVLFFIFLMSKIYQTFPKKWAKLVKITKVFLFFSLICEVCWQSCMRGFCQIGLIVPRGSRKI
jgi:hypothetical protein